MGGMFICNCCDNQKHSDDGYNICEQCEKEICECCMVEDVGISARCLNCFEIVDRDRELENIEEFNHETEILLLGSD